MNDNSAVAIARALSLTGLLLGLAGCAALRAPAEFTPAKAPSAAALPLQIEPVEGRPNGLVLRFTCACELPDDGWLQLLRARGDETAQLFRNIRLDARLRDRLTGTGLELLDRSIDPQPTHYQLRVRAAHDDAPGQTLHVSAPLVVRWRTPPARPAELQAHSHIAGTVELRWMAPADTGALIFRRNVLDSSARWERLARVGPSAQGIFVDRQVEPAGVYAYRVALAIDTTSTVQFGRPSEELYVTVHTAPVMDAPSDEARQKPSGS